MARARRAPLAVLAIALAAGCTPEVVRPPAPTEERSRAVERYNLGLAYRDEGNLDRALEVLREARLHDPEDTSFQAAEIDVLLRLGRSAEALGRAREAVLVVRDPVPIRRLQAEAALRAGAADEAERAAQAVLAADPRDVEALVLLGRARAERGDLAGAQAHLDDACEAAPATESAPFVWAAALALSAGEARDAIQRAREGLDRDGRSYAAYAVLAEAYWRLNERTVAVEMMRRYLTLAPPGEAESPRGQRMRGLRDEMERSALSP